MPRLQHDPEKRREAIRDVTERGISVREVARRLRVTEQTVRNWVYRADPAGHLERELAAGKEGQVPPDASAPPAAAPERTPGEASTPTGDAAPPDGANSSDSLESARALRNKLLQIASEAERDGNTTVALRAYRDAGQQQLVIARMERDLLRAGGVTVISEDEIQKAEASLRAQFERLAERPLLCSDCGRKLAIQIATTQGDL